MREISIYFVYTFIESLKIIIVDLQSSSIPLDLNNLNQIIALVIVRRLIPLL